MTDDKQTESVRYLHDRITGMDKEREKQAVNRLLSLGGHLPKQASKYDNPLIREMMKGLDDG